MADTINDVMYTALKDAGFDDNVTAMLLNWQRSLDINGWTAYVEHVMANTTAEHFADAEYEFWVNYTGEEPPSFTPADLSPALWIDPSDASTVTISGSSGAYIGADGLIQTAVAGNYAVSPDIAAYDITAEAEIVMRLSLTDWTPATTNTLMCHKNGFAGIELEVHTNGALRLRTDAAVTSSSVVSGFTDGATYWIKVTYSDAADEVKFFYAADQPTEPSSWTQLGATVACVSVLSASTAALHVGGGLSGLTPMAGTLRRAIIRSSIDGPAVFDADFENATPFVSAFTESALGAPVYVVSSTATSATANYGYIGPNGFVSNAGSNWAEANDSAALDIAGDIDLIAKLSAPNWNTGVRMNIITKGTAASAAADAWVWRTTTTGELQFQASNGVGYRGATSTVATGVPAGGTKWLRVTRASSSGDVKFYTSDDGTTWTQLGATVNDGGGAINVGSTKMYVGAYATNNQNWIGTIHRAIVKDGIDGTVVFDADFTTAPDYAASFVESSSNAATVTITATNTPANAAGALVSQINDKSGNARHLTQGTAANMPKYWNGLNGLNCLVFDGTSDYMTGALASSAVDDFGMSAVFAQTVNTNQVAPVHNGTSSNGWGIAAQAAVGFVGWLRGGAAWEASATAYPSTPSTVVLARRSGVAELWKDSTQTNIATATAPLLPTTQTQIGSHSAVGNWFGGRLGEFVVWTAATAQHIVDVRAYEKAKWGTP